MRSILLGLCSALAAGMACAQTLPSHEQLAHSQSLMWLNVKGGQFQSLVIDSFDSPVQMEMELTLERANPHPKWAPGSSVCVTDKSAGHEACVRIAAYDAEADGVYAYKTFHKTTDGRTTLLSREPVAGQFKMGSKIRVAMRSGADSVEFKVEDGAWLMQALPFTPHALRLLCSSALCKLRLNENTAAPPGA